MQEWRIIFSQFSEAHLSSRPPVNLGRTVTFEAPASIIWTNSIVACRLNILELKQMHWKKHGCSWRQDLCPMQ